MATMNSKQTVRQGPGTNYDIVGTVSAGEAVTCQWQESSWVYIQYSVQGTGFKKQGYVPYSTISGVSCESFTPDMQTRFVGKGCIPFFGPSNRGYSHTEAVPQGVAVLYTGKESANKKYVFVQYGDRRFWLDRFNLSDTKPTTAGYSTLSGFLNFQQRDSAWQKNNSDFADKGCAVCCCADVVSFAEGKSINPNDIYMIEVFIQQMIVLVDGIMHRQVIVSGWMLNLKMWLRLLIWNK